MLLRQCLISKLDYSSCISFEAPAACIPAATHEIHGAKKSLDKLLYYVDYIITDTAQHTA